MTNCKEIEKEHDKFPLRIEVEIEFLNKQELKGVICELENANFNWNCWSDNLKEILKTKSWK